MAVRYGLTCMLVTLLGVGAARAGDWPAPIQQLADKGLTVVKRFDAPGGLTGYAARAGHTPVALYLTPDGHHVIVGTMLDAHGHDLSQKALDAAITQPQQQSAWPQLEAATWIADGPASAPRTVYVFTDPNCPYCHRFYEAARPWVKAGKVQLRTILVGVLKPSSPGKAAAILAAKNPVAAYRRHEADDRTGGIQPLNPVPSSLSGKLAANDALMTGLGIRGTPGIVTRDKQGGIHIHQGMPQGDTLTDILGPKP
ncbi:thiol:disulfide interchange protein DsbG [Salinisphaera sp. RV14]|uniref:thiol:disulfide interchange protein DsbG n=1 Tax=unclassified Salinisphaera TaxID=2649847 RepID=UPI003F844BA3